MSAAAVAIDGGRDPETGRFVSGNVGGPGRKPGSRAKLSTMFLDDLRDAWERGGAEVIAKVMKNDPSTFLRVVAGLMPKDVNLSIGVDQFVLRAPTVMNSSADWQAATGIAQIEMGGSPVPAAPQNAPAASVAALCVVEAVLVEGEG